jgi:hypothetical protein
MVLVQVLFVRCAYVRAWMRSYETKAAQGFSGRKVPIEMDALSRSAKEFDVMLAHVRPSRLRRACTHAPSRSARGRTRRGSVPRAKAAAARPARA